MISAADQQVVAEQLGRPLRGVTEVAHRCPCGNPDVVETSPRLPDGSPFPTLYYLTCPRVASAIGTLEASGLMAQMTQRLSEDSALAESYRQAHEAYLVRRAELGSVAEIEGISAGGMPERVKCLHVLVAHALAAGPGVNPLGDEALALLPDWWAAGACVGGKRDGSTRVAGIDCGTNSIRLLVGDLSADPSGGAGLAELHREMRVVRLGQDVDRTGRLAPAALARTRSALVDYAELIRQFEVDRVRMVATSASRDAANADEFVALVQGVLGIEPEVISGLAEASLSFTGAVGLLTGLPERVLLADIGGGSTELALGVGGVVQAAHSMDVGCVRMTERHLHSDPPTAEEIDRTTRDLRMALDAAAEQVPLTTGAAFVGVAGTVTTIVAIALGLPAYDPVAIHGARISFDQVSAVTSRLLTMTRAERAALPVMHPGRVDVIGGGALVLRTVMEYLGATDVIASEHDILDGIALSLR